MIQSKLTGLPLLLPLALLLGLAASHADASWFHDKTTGISRNVGSAPNPTPADLVTINRGPHYPMQSRMFKEEGTVGLNVWLSEHGTVDTAVIHESSGYPRLDDAAIRFIKDRWHYRPANKDLPMPKAVQAQVTFKLD